MVSHETIYCWIWNDKRQGGDLHKSLRRQGRKYSKRGSKNAGRGFIPNRVEIDQRPSIVEQKERFGDLEIDTIIGKNHKGAILTINDRATSESGYVSYQERSHPCSKDYSMGIAKSKKLNTHNNG